MAIQLGTNAYVDAATFNTWAGDRNIDLSSFTASQIDAAIIVASIDFIDSYYDFKGVALSDSQAMQLPTDEVAIADIEQAACHAVNQQLKGKLFKEYDAEGVVISKSIEAGVKSSKKYAAPVYNKFPTDTIDRLLSPYLLASGGMGGLYRG